MQKPVTSISPLSGAEDDVTVTFQGDALGVLRDMRDRLGVADEQAVVLKAIELLLSTVGKEVLLREGKRTEVIRLWQS
jgi:hypothetical protein